MPDQWNSWIPVQSTPQDSWDSWEPVTQPKKPSTTDWLIEQGLRTGLPIAGGLIGSTIGPEGTALGYMLGSGAGAALGYLGGNAYSGKEFNPAEMAVDTGLGMIPPIFGPPELAGTGIKDLIKYGAKTAGMGALEGGLISAGSTPFQHAAQTGSFDAPLSEYASNAVSGAGMGTVLGGGLGLVHGGMARNKILSAVPPPTPEPPPYYLNQPPPGIGPSGQLEFPFMRSDHYSQRPPVEPPTEPVQPNLFNADESGISYNEPFQGDFTNQFGMYRTPRGKFTMQQPPFERNGQYSLPGIDPYHSHEPVSRPTPFQVGNPGIGEPISFTKQPTMEDMAPPTPRPPTTPPTVPPVAPSGPPPEGVPNIPGVKFVGDLAVLMPATAPKIAILKELGYEAKGDSVDNWPAMRLRENLSETAYTRAQRGETPPSVESPAVEGMKTEPIPIGPNGEFTVPKNHATPSKLRKLLSQGYSVLEEMPNGDVRVGPSTFDPRTDIAQAKVTRTKRGYQDLTPETYKRYSVFDENDNLIHKTYDSQEAQRYADDHNGYVQDSGTFDPRTDIAQARAKGGGLVGDFDTRRGITNLTKDYSGAIEGIMKREGMQNAFDSIKKFLRLGGKDARIVARTNEKNGTIEIHDNGSGMDEDTLSEKLVRIFGTGKENEEGASGGKGIGSASYIYGGKHFEIETVAIDANDGKKYRIKAGGTPDQFLDPIKGSDWERVEVPMSTPTGSTMKVTVKDETHGNILHARVMMDDIIHHSRDMPGIILYDRSGTSTDRLQDVREDNPHFYKETIKSSANDKLIGDLTVPGAKVEIKIPKFDESQERKNVLINYLNNGMFQFSRPVTIDKPSKGLPPHVLVDIKPTVDEQHGLYPFTNTREHLKDDIRDALDKFITKGITRPAIERRVSRTQELYDAMAHVPMKGTTRNPIFFDPGDRLTPAERELFLKSKFIQEFIRHNDQLAEGILYTVGRSEWDSKLEGVGVILDPRTNGLHIPNPTTENSSIGYNPFHRIEYMTPADAAFAHTITALHEVAHIGTEKGTDIQLAWKPQDMADPRIGKFMQAYADQMLEHGDVSWNDTGHRLDFMQRLGEVFSKFGVADTFNAADQLERIYTNGNKSGGYSPEIQRLLQIYNESRGRAAVTDDLLSPTGTQQANRKSTGAGNVPGNAEGHGVGVSPEQTVKKPSVGRQLYNFARGITTTLDLSAPLRQGLPLIFSKEFRKSFGTMMKSLGSEEAFQKSLADLKNRKMFQRRYDAESGRVIKSFAELAGIKLTELHGPISGREEAIASDWVESGGFLGSDFPFLNRETGPQRAFQSTVGRATRGSNRAYTAFLNQLRADSFESLVTDAYRDFKAGTKGSKDPYTDLTYAREIADFVNTATGRGPLKVAFPGVTGGRLGEGGKVGMREYSGERFAKFFTDVIFSPRLMASRVRMLNPGTYMMASPFVRKQYIKSLLAVAGFAGTVGALAKGMGADVSMDPNSSDFGKIKIGNTRLDMAGGFQQYLVAASRLVSGHTTSSASGKDFELGQGYRPPTRGDVIQNFMTNKLHPITKFANDLVFASTHQPFQVADRTLQLFVPLVIGDVLELAKEDPKLLPLLGPITFGAGSQTYDKGSVNSRFIPAKNDYNFTGGAPY